MKKGLTIAFLTGITVTVFACYSTITFGPATIDSCSSSPCSITTISPATSICDTQTRRTDQNCVYGPGTYQSTSTLYQDGTCNNGHCTGAIFASQQISTNYVANLIPCGG